MYSRLKSPASSRGSLGVHIHISIANNASITLDEWHAWFNLYELSRAVRNEKWAKNSKWKYMHPTGFDPATFHTGRKLTQRLRPTDLYWYIFSGCRCICNIQIFGLNRLTYSRCRHCSLSIFYFHINIGKRIGQKFKAILQVLIYKALYDKSYLGSKTTMTSGEWTCLISFAKAPLTCSERGGSEKFKMKIYVSSGIRTHTLPVHDREVAAP